jgi:hypothetical protein
MGVLQSWVGGVVDLAVAALVALGGTLVTVGKTLKGNRDRSMSNKERSKANQRLAAENERRSKQNAQRIAGDPENPNHDSLMGLASDNADRLDDMEQTQERILRTVDSIADELDGTFYRGDADDD